MSDTYSTGNGRRRKRNVMKEFVINEISAVDVPAQTGARATIMKRNGANVDKAMTGPRPGESRNDFNSRFTQSAEAMREYPDQTKRLAAANRAFRDRDGGTDKVADEEVEKRFGILSQVEGHQHVTDIMGPSGLLSRGSSSYSDGHNHDWVRREDGTIAVLMAEGHTHDIDENIQVLEKQGDDSTSGDDAGQTNAASKGGGNQSAKEKPMSGDNTKAAAELAKAETTIDELTKSVKELKEKLEASTAIAALNATQKAHYDGLAEDERAGFLAKSEDERDEAITKAGEADPVIYKAANGDTYRKSDDPRLVKMAQERDADRKDLAKRDAVIADQDLTKRATEQLATFPGSVEVHKVFLKAADAVTDETLRKECMEALKAQNARMSDALKVHGASSVATLETSSDDISAAEAELEKRAQARVAKGEDYFDAYHAETQADPQLAKRAQGSIAVS